MGTAIYTTPIGDIRRLLLVFLSILLFLPGWTQQANLSQLELAEQLHSMSLNAPPELAYIQTSKDVFETGEDLWFKVYLLDAQYLMPSLISRTLYLQLFNENTRKAVWSEKYEIQSGIASGRVYLESNLQEGNYLLAAYTPNSFFDDTTEFKAVRRLIVRKDITSRISLPEKQVLMGTEHGRSESIQFNIFPEGGNLVSGLDSKVAFKAVNKSGEPVDITGTLFENDKPLVEFKSLHAGMGSFGLIPDASKKYSIRLSTPAIDSTFILPEISVGGMMMRLTERDNESLYFKISQLSGRDGEGIYLRVQCRGIVYGMTSAKLNREILIKLPLSDLPQGIAEVTLFNSSLVPVAERLVYINQGRKLNITTELSKDIYPTRGKATLKIKVKDEFGYPVVADLGVSVFDKLYQNPRDSNNILSHFYLSEQLKGRIYNPSYYFNSKSKNRDEAMDLLMLTQGWRKYIWNETNLRNMGGARQIIFDGIKGKIYYPDRIKKIPKEQTFVTAFSPNKDSIKVLIQADSAAGFIIGPGLLKEWENDFVYLKPFGPYDSKRQTKTFDPLSRPEFNLSINVTDPFEIINRQIKVNEIIYPLPSLITEKEDKSEQYSVESGVIRIKEVTIKGQKAKSIRGKYLGSLDSIAMANSDEDYVCKYGVLNCPRHDRTEPFTTKPRQGFEYFVIYYYNTPGEYTRRVRYFLPNYSEEDLLRINNIKRVKAYYGTREFYKPDYDQEKGDSLIPDFRNTLLWEPSVITNEKGEATLSFYCSDINTDFTGRIEGVSDEGLLGAEYFKFTVRKIKPTP